MFRVTREEMTQGSIARSLLLLATPLVLQNFVQVAQQIVDTFWVGRLGENAVAAVGLNFPIVALLFAVFIGINTGTQVLASQRVGDENVTGARRAVFHGVTLGLSSGVTLAVFVWLVATPLVSVLGPGQDVGSLAVTYLTTFALGLPIVAMSDALEMGFISWGDSRAALYINVTAVVVNIVLDPFLILGLGPFPELEVQGAALATVIGYGAGLLLAVGMLLRNDDTDESYTFTTATVDFDLDEYRELVEVGLPNSGQHAARTSARVLVMGVVSAVGGAAGVAAYTICARIATVAYTPASGLNRAAQSVIGQNLGANKPSRARRTTWVGVTIAAVGLSVVATVQWLFPATLTTLFVPDISAAGFELAVTGLQVFAVSYWAIGASYLFEAGFNGARRTTVSMVASLLQYWAVRLPIAAVGAVVLGFGVEVVFWAVTLSNVAGALGVGGYYYYTTSNGMLERAADSASGAPSD